MSADLMKISVNIIALMMFAYLIRKGAKLYAGVSTP
jgi:hypothetical protein